MEFLLFATLLHITIHQTCAYSVTLHNVTDTLKPEHEKYTAALKEAELAFHQAEQLFTDPNFEHRQGWKMDGKSSAFSIHSKPTPEGRITVVSTILDGTVDDVMHEAWAGIEALPSWNPTIAYSEFIVALSDNADILIYGNKDIAVVTGREFLTSRLYRKTPTGYIMASRSVDLPERPERKEKVRANVFLAASQFRPDPTHPRKTICDVAMSADLNGNLSKQLVESAMPTIMAMITEQNIKHFKELNKYSK